jgi:TPR repeat protein
LFQSYRGHDSDEGNSDWEFEPSPSHPFRGYIAAVLAIVIGALGYMAWRGMQSSQGSHLASPAAPVVASEAAPADNAPEHPTVSNESNAPAAAKSPTEAPPSKFAETATKEPEKKAARTGAVRATPVEPTGTAAVTQPTSVGGKGSEELAIAQRYLYGTNGQRRDTAEASKWLWKSIAKHNSEATLLLADLYLKGDGVSKNCDQARVLLYSAARKNVSGAGERLRNLPAFGCQ